MAAEPQKVDLAGTFHVNNEDSFTISHGDEQSDENILFRDLIIALSVAPENNSIEPEYDLLSVQILGQQDPETTKERKESAFSLKTTRVKGCPASFLEKYALSMAPSHLSDCKGSTANRVFDIVISTKSGVCEAESYYNEIVRGVLSRLGFSERDYKVHFTSSERWISDFAFHDIYARANEGIFQTILLLSGDGGITDIINGLFKRPCSDRYVKPTVGLLVLGTGNALANSSGLNNDSTKGLSIFLRGQPQSIPTFFTRFSPGSVLLTDEARKTEPLVEDGGAGIVHGAVVTSWGLHAALVADSDTTEYRKFGRERFSMAAKELLSPSDGSQSHSYKGQITTFKLNGDGTYSKDVWQRKDHMYILATLVSNLEAALKISPQSKPLDGQLRLVHFGVLPSSSVMRIFGLAFKGGIHVQEESVGYESIDALRIEFQEQDARWRRICVDGKIFRVEEGGWVEVRKETRDVVDLIIDASSSL